MKRRVQATGRTEKLGRAPKGERILQKDPDTQVREAEQQRIVLNLRMQGTTIPVIARHLGVDERTVKRLHARAFESYMSDHTEFVQVCVAEARATYDALRRTWWIRAVGGTQVQPDGSERVFEPDLEAARMIIRAQRDLNLLVTAGQPVRIEHTGVGGGPVVTAQVDAMEAARLVRQIFVSKVEPPLLARGATVEINGSDGKPTH